MDIGVRSGHGRSARSSRALPLVLACLLVGCGSLEDHIYNMMGHSLASPEAPAEGSVALQPLAPVRRDIFTRSYRLGDAYVAHSGDTVVSIKNYSITERVGRATTLRDFGQTCTRRLRGRSRATLCEDSPLSSVRGALGSVFDVVGAATFPDGQYFVIALPSDGSSQVYLLADPTGRLRKGAYVAWREELTPGTTLGRVPVMEFSPEIAMDPDSPLFSFESVEKLVYMGPGYLNFDLVFTGTRDTVRGDMITFSYREFGRDSTERPIFERLLQFPSSTPVVEVDKLRIEVVPMGYNDLRFRVISDGQPEPNASDRARWEAR